jgi:hypothetical protein
LDWNVPFFNASLTFSGFEPHSGNVDQGREGLDSDADLKSTKKEV